MHGLVQTGRPGEEKYWATLAMAAGSIINGNCDEAVKGFLSAVRGFLSNGWDSSESHNRSTVLLDCLFHQP